VTRTRALVLGSLTVVAAVAALALVFGANDDDGATLATTGDSHDLRIAGRPASVPVARDLARDVEHRYDVSIDHVTDDGDPANAFRIAVAGTWAVQVANVDDDRGTVTYRAELRGATAKVTGRGRTVDDTALAAALSLPHTITTSSDGRVVALGVADTLAGPGRGAIATIAAGVLIAGTPMAGGWEADESDPLGTYRAAYRVRGGATLDKTKLRYETSVPGVATTIVSSATTIALRADGWAASVDGRDVVRVAVGEVALAVDATIRVADAGAVAIVPGDLPRGLTTVAINALGDDAAARADADRVLVDGASLDDLLAELALVGDENARAYQFLRLAALFRLDDAAAGDGAKRVAGGLEPPARDAVIGALGEAGTAVAEAGLADLVDTAKLPSDARSHAAASLGLARDPEPSTLLRLATASRADGDVGATATLALGNAVLRARDPDLAATQVDSLLARLAGARDDHEAALVLRALGNTGDPRILPAIENALAGDGPLSRVAAAEAIRLVPGSRADGLVASTLFDETVLVRSAAVFSASFRDLGVLGSALDRSLRVDPAVEVRRAIVDLAGERMADVPALRGLVAYAAEHDRDAELRAAARAML
jgi:hypothetical protein